MALFRKVLIAAVAALAFPLLSPSLLARVAAPGLPLFREAAAPAIPAPTLGLYLIRGPEFAPINPATLADIPNGPSITLADGSLPSPALFISPAGTAIAAASYEDARAGGAAIVRIVDERTGRVRSRVSLLLSPREQRQTRQAAPFLSGVSNDGRLLYGDATTQRGRVIWYTIDGIDGRIVHETHLREPRPMATLYEPTQHRLYVFGGARYVVGRPTGSHTLTIAAYDTLHDRQVGRLVVSGVLAGSWPMARKIHGYPLTEMHAPGAALSPDGRQIAVVDGNRNVLLLIDTRTLNVTRTLPLVQASSGVDLAGLLGTGVAEAKSFQGEQVDIRFSPDGQQLYETGMISTFTGSRTEVRRWLGVRLIDVATGRIEATALADGQVWDAYVAPDGSGVYAFTATTDGNCPCLLDRLDPAALHVVASRPFEPGTVGGVIALPVPERAWSVTHDHSGSGTTWQTEHR
jgi:hypothetical protein